jgi:hypothetical protein
MPEDIIIATLREKNVPITNESYATLAYWRSYQKLSKEERLDVREAVRETTTPNPSVRQQQPAHTVRILVCCRHEALPEPLG